MPTMAVAPVSKAVQAGTQQYLRLESPHVLWHPPCSLKGYNKEMFSLLNSELLIKH